MRHAAVALVFLSLRAAAWGAAGDLDLSFGTNGAVVAQLSTDWDEVNAMAAQPDGMIVVGGMMGLPEGFVARYDAGGTLDPTFGVGGIAAVTALGSVEDLVLQPDGKIVVAGPGNFGTMLVRLDSDGTLDGDFGTGGEAVTGIDGGTDGPGGLVLQTDGKIVVGGESADGGDFALARFHADGAVDMDFGTLGIAAGVVDPDHDATLFDVVRQPDGKFVAGGEGSTDNHYDFALARFEADGALDTGYGTGGVVLQPIFGATSDERIDALVAQPDGKIVALGAPLSDSSAFVVARFTDDGDLDAGFGPNGTQIFGVAGSDFGHDLALTSSGKVLVAGETSGRLTVARLTSTGFLDPTFGNGGVARYSSPPISSCCSQLHAVAIQPDGKIVAGGFALVTFQQFRFDAAVIRLFGGECGNGVVEPGEDCETTSRAAPRRATSRRPARRAPTTDSPARATSATRKAPARIPATSVRAARRPFPRARSSRFATMRTPPATRSPGGGGRGRSFRWARSASHASPRVTGSAASMRNPTSCSSSTPPPATRVWAGHAGARTGPPGSATATRLRHRPAPPR